MKLSISKLAELTGKNRRTIKKRIADFDPVKKEGSAYLYDTTKVFTAIYYADFETNAPVDPERVSEGPSEKVAQTRYRTAKAEKMEMELEKFKGKLIETEKVCGIVEKHYSFVRSALMAVPTRIAKQVSSIDEPEEAHEIIQSAINEALTELSEVKFEPVEDDE